MNNQEILTKAIEKARENGWQPIGWRSDMPVYVRQWQDNGMVEIGIYLQGHNNEIQWDRELEGIIFNHDFAKALWGHAHHYKCDYEPLPTGSGDWAGMTDTISVWEFHLQQMVIADDPIKYLEKHL